MSDLISREKLLSTIRPMVGMWEDETFWISYERVMDIIESAEPERKWIPVTEALPDTNNDVLLQFKSNMAVGYYEDDGWNIATGEDLYSGVDESEDKPIAWMPLPEPWRGE
jgi:hypothetical protein